MSSSRVAAACAVVFDQNGNVLLHLRSDIKVWGLPGGRAEQGETLDQCAVREVKEETGYDVRVKRLIGVYSDPKFTTITYPDGSSVAYVTACFECELIGGERMLNAESDDIAFFDPNKLPTNFMINHVPRMADALARQEAAFYR